MIFKISPSVSRRVVLIVSSFIQLTSMLAHGSPVTDYRRAPISVIASWLHNSSVFSSSPSPGRQEDLDISQIDLGVRDTEIFTVKAFGKKYIVKVTPYLFELRQSQFNDSFLVDPEHASPEQIKKALKNKVDLTAEQLKYIPRIPRILASHTISDSLQTLYLILQEHAEGQMINSIQTPAVYREVGKSLGAFHYFLAKDKTVAFKEIQTWSHGDPHGGNLFFDQKTTKLTLIDYSQLKDDGTYKDVLKDLDEIFICRLRDHRLWLENEFRATLSQSTIENQEQAFSILKQRDWNETLNYKNIKLFFELINSFMDGYFLFVPEQMKEEILFYFQRRCTEQAYELMWLDRTKGLDFHFFAEWKDILPASWIACMKGQFTLNSTVPEVRTK